MKALKLVFRNLARQPRRAILAVLTFAVATFIFTVLISIPASIDLILKATADTLRLYSYNADGRYLGLPARLCRQIEQIPGVVGCVPMGFLRATYQSEREIIQALAIDADKAALMYPDYGLRQHVLERFAHDRTATIAGKLLIRTHHWKIGDVITLRGDSNRLDMRFVLVGEIPSNNYPNFFIFRRDYLVEAEKAIGIPEEKHPAGFLVTRVAAAKDMQLVIHEIDETFHNSDFETATMTESEAASGLMSTVGDIRSIVYSIFGVVLLTVFLIAANVMSLMVRDRLGEVAVLRALGFAPSYIALTLLGECTLIGAAGGVLGGAFTLMRFGGGTALGGILESAGYLTITPMAVAEAFGAAVSISILSGLLPALRALGVTAAEAFRKAI